MGRLVITQRVARELELATVVIYLVRHLNMDWGDLCEEDKEANAIALESANGRLLSRYNTLMADSETRKDVYIITESDRSRTTVLFVDEY